MLMRDDGSFSVVSSRSGRVKWREEKYDKAPGDIVERILAVRDGTAYFLLQRWTDAEGDPPGLVMAYRLRKRRELWKRKIPPAFGASSGVTPGQTAPLVIGDTLVLPSSDFGMGGGQPECCAVSLDNGRKLWEQKYPDVRLSSFTLNALTPNGLLLTGGRDGRVEARSLRTGKLRWKSEVRGETATAHAVGHGTVYVIDEKETVYALDLRDGRTRWRRRWPGAPIATDEDDAMTLSASGDVLLLSTDDGVIALDTRNGKLLWRFAAVAAEGVGPPSSDEALGKSPGRVVGQVPGMVFVTTLHALYALPVD